MAKKILSVLLAFIIYLSLFPAYSAGAATPILTIQYTGSDHTVVDAKFKTILGTWLVDTTEKSAVSGEIDTSWGSTTKICGAIISSVASGYTLSGWKITIGSDVKIYTKETDGNIFKPDYTFGCWYGDVGTQWVGGDVNPQLGGIVFCYIPAEDIVVEPIFDNSGSAEQPFMLDVISGNSEEGSVSKKYLYDNGWELKAQPKSGFAVENWGYRPLGSENGWMEVPGSRYRDSIEVTLNEDTEYWKAMGLPDTVKIN